MRILINVTYYYPHWTGLTQYAIGLAEGLAQQGHKVKVLTTQHQVELKRDEVINGVEVIRCKPTWRFSRSIISWELVKRLVREIKGVDKIFCFLPLNEVLIVSILGKLFRKKVFLVHNGDLVLPKGFVNTIIEKVFFVTTKLAIKLSRGIILNTADYPKFSPLLRNEERKWIVLVPPIGIFSADPKILQQIKTKIGKPRFVVGFSGRWVEEKGFDVLLKAIPLVTKNLAGVKFVFAGQLEVDYEKTYQKDIALIEKVHNNLIILGKLKRDEMMAFYKTIDLLVISSRSDFFPFVQAEALLSGVPVVVTDIPGARWLVKTTGAGIIVKPENPQALAKGVIEALDKLIQLKRNTKKTKEIFKYNNLIIKYEELLYE
jgi:glycosyltransferase involved in cell wall biosynthesis